jgi:hypothetical protein
MGNSAKASAGNLSGAFFIGENRFPDGRSIGI